MQTSDNKNPINEAQNSGPEPESSERVTISGPALVVVSLNVFHDLSHHLKSFITE